MTIHHTARHQVKAPEAGKVKAAIVAFVETSRTSRQQDAHRVAAEDDPTKFVRLFEFADRSAHQAHGTRTPCENRNRQ